MVQLRGDEGVERVMKGSKGWWGKKGEVMLVAANVAGVVAY